MVLPWQHCKRGIPPTGSLVVITTRVRLVLTRSATLSVYSRSPGPRSSAGRFVTRQGR